MSSTVQFEVLWTIEGQAGPMVKTFKLPPHITYLGQLRQFLHISYPLACISLRGRAVDHSVGQAGTQLPIGFHRLAPHQSVKTVNSQPQKFHYSFQVFERTIDPAKSYQVHVYWEGHHSADNFAVLETDTTATLYQLLQKPKHLVQLTHNGHVLPCDTKHTLQTTRISPGSRLHAKCLQNSRQAPATRLSESQSDEVVDLTRDSPEPTCTAPEAQQAEGVQVPLEDLTFERWCKAVDILELLDVRPEHCLDTAYEAAMQPLTFVPNQVAMGQGAIHQQSAQVMQQQSGLATQARPAASIHTVQPNPNPAAAAVAVCTAAMGEMHLTPEPRLLYPSTHPGAGGLPPIHSRPSGALVRPVTCSGNQHHAIVPNQVAMGQGANHQQSAQVMQQWSGLSTQATPAASIHTVQPNPNPAAAAVPLCTAAMGEMHLTPGPRWLIQGIYPGPVGLPPILSRPSGVLLTPVTSSSNQRHATTLNTNMTRNDAPGPAYSARVHVHHSASYPSAAPQDKLEPAATGQCTNAVVHPFIPRAGWEQSPENPYAPASARPAMISVNSMQPRASLYQTVLKQQQQGAHAAARTLTLMPSTSKVVPTDDSGRLAPADQARGVPSAPASPLASAHTADGTDGGDSVRSDYLSVADSEDERSASPSKVPKAAHNEP